ncbi:MAG: N-acetylglutamate synthase, CG3035 family [Mycobacteriaceae bacterium]
MPTPGQRVMMRYLLPAGSSHPMTDVLGMLESVDPVAVRAEDGTVTTVESSQVVALKAIPPRPVSRVAVRNLEHAAALAWPGLEQEWLGGWLLRAGAGFTLRANSAVPLQGPATIDAVEHVRAWYAHRGLPARFQLPDRLPSPSLPGWELVNETLVLTADTAALAGAPVTVTAAPQDEWLAGYHRADKLPAEGPAVLSAVLDGELGFGQIAQDGAVRAIARAAVTAAPDGTRWLGLTAVEVAPSARRQGLGTRICAGLAAWGLEHGAQKTYLQVAADNDAALVLCERLGLTTHHRYRYRYATER